MSASLVKKGLKLFQDDFKSAKTSAGNKQRDKSSGKKSGKQASFKDRKVKSALKKFAKKNIKEDRTAVNLEILTKLSKTKPVDWGTVSAILQQHHKRHQQPTEKKKPEKSVFTEEDFKKFEQEYFVNVK